MKTPVRIAGAVAIIALGYLTYRYVLFPPSAKISAEELASVQRLEPRLPEMVVSQADAVLAAADAYDCLAAPSFAMPVADAGAGPNLSTAWCSASGSFIASTVTLPRDDDSPTGIAAREVELQSSSSGRAEGMADDFAAPLVPIDGSALFVKLPGVDLGAFSHTLQFRAQYPGRAQVYNFYDIRFLERWIDVQIRIVLLGADTNDAVAAAMAAAVYARIGVMVAEQITPTPGALPPEAPTEVPTAAPVP